MIKLTINPHRSSLSAHSHSQTLVFDKSSVVVGTVVGDEIDVSLPGEHLSEALVQIVEQNGRFLAINSAHDPFTTLNGAPFGKAILTNNAILQIGSTLIRIETSLTPTSPTSIPTTSQPAKPSPKETVNTQELEDLMQQVAQLDAPPPAPTKATTPHQAPTTPTPTPSHHSHHHPAKAIEVIDDIEAPKPEPEPLPIEPATTQQYKINRYMRLLFMFGMFVMLTAIISAAVLYVRISGKSDAEKVIAAEGVGDVAMALMYAQIHHIKPQKQNWFDPEFLKNNLAAVLASDYPSFANIDSQGQFTNCQYILRIYTSNDLSQFVVIAQPEPSILQWLAPQAAVAIDSKAMEMRHIDDIKTLNRLLVNANTLNESNALEIFEEIKKGDLINLATLGYTKEFAPPKALALVRPGAENLIYNAPRYYHFGEALLKQAVSLLQLASSSNEVSRLQQQVSELTKLPNLVLYSTQGMQKATQAQRALATLSPGHPFLIAYLNLNTDGVVATSHLLYGGDQVELLPQTRLATPISTESKPSHDSSSSLTAMTLPSPEQHPIVKEANLDIQHPLFLQLSSMASERQRTLQAIREEMLKLLSDHISGRTLEFSAPFAALLQKYEQADNESRTRIIQRLSELYAEYLEMPLLQLTNYIKAAGLTLLSQESVNQSVSSSSDIPAITSSIVNDQLHKIQTARDFSELDAAVTETAQLLNLKHLPDPNKLILYQNDMRTQTTQQLSRFMLSSATKLPSSEFQEANRSVLMRILKTAWITDPSEQSYYLSEFDLLVQSSKRRN